MATIVKNGKYVFTEAEIQDLKNDLVRNRLGMDVEEDALDALKRATKDHKANLASLIGKNGEIAKAVQKGHENRSFECYELKDWTKFVKVYYDKDSGSSIVEEPFEASDYQISVDDEALLVQKQKREESKDLDVVRLVEAIRKLEADLSNSEGYVAAIRRLQIAALEELLVEYEPEVKKVVTDYSKALSDKALADKIEEIKAKIADTNVYHILGWELTALLVLQADRVGSGDAITDTKVGQNLDEKQQNSIVDLYGADIDLDTLFQDAVTLSIEKQSISASMIQRKLKVGRKRALLILDQLEAGFICGPDTGSPKREVFWGTELEAAKGVYNKLAEKSDEEE